mmetsp:Transcript_15355/g.43949  ORF Transcript_15355/g.43949 Transcript_15355/m.43949 type:complete len:405 (-) Transcript_15355:17-1231(-)
MKVQNKKQTGYDAVEIPQYCNEYAKAIVQHVAAKDYERAEACADAMAKVCKQSSCKAIHHSLIHACSKLSSPEAALWCALRMVRIGLKPNTVTFNALLDASAKSGDIAMATRLWDLMVDLKVSPNAITYNTMMNACAKANDVRRAEWWLERMHQDGVEMCAVSFHTVIAAYTKLSDFERAESWFGKMQQAGVKADRVIYNSMICARAKAGHAEQTEYWAAEMERNGLVPDEKAYNTVVSLWARSGSSKRALHWLRKMESQGYTASKQTLAAVVESWVKMGDAANAKHWIDIMVARGMAPDLAYYYSRINNMQQKGATPFHAKDTLALSRGAWAPRAGRGGDSAARILPQAYGTPPEAYAAPPRAGPLAADPWPEAGAPCRIWPGGPAGLHHAANELYIMEPLSV